VHLCTRFLRKLCSNWCSTNCFGQGAVAPQRRARLCAARRPPCAAGPHRPRNASPQAARRLRHALPQAPHPEALKSPRGPRAARRAVPAGAHRGPLVRRWQLAVRAPAEEAGLRPYVRHHGNVTGEDLTYKSRSEPARSSRRLSPTVRRRPPLEPLPQPLLRSSPAPCEPPGIFPSTYLTPLARASTNPSRTLAGARAPAASAGRRRRAPSPESRPRRPTPPINPR
jgi:hypothetical protein